MVFRCSVLLAAALLLSACANQYDLGSVKTEVPQTNRPVAVSVVERRPYVLSGKKPASFVGLQQLGVTEPLDVSTQSGAPLADDFTEVLAAAFFRQGTETYLVPLETGQAAEDALPGFAESPSERLLVVEIQEWKTDTLVEVSASWDLVARVYDRSGTELAEQRERGQRTWDDIVVLTQQKNQIAQEHVAQLFRQLLGRPAIERALTDDG